MNIDSNNHVHIKGNVGIEPQFRRLDSGSRVATFSIATCGQRYNAQTGKYEDVINQQTGKADTQWHRVVAWNGFADRVLEQVEKGSLVEVTGELRYREWDHPTATEPDGKPVKLRGTEIIARDLSVVMRPARRDQAPAHTDADNPYQQRQSAPQGQPYGDDYDVGDLGPPLDMDDSPADYSG